MVLVAAIAVVGGICGTAFADTPDFAVTPTLGSFGAWNTPSWYSGTYNGGEFNVAVHSPGTSYYQAAVANAAGGGNNFSTFCVQQNQVFSPGGTYCVKADTQTDGGQDIPLTGAVAYLYHRWNSGTLTGYDYLNSTAEGRLSSAVDLQEVIWKLMYESAGGTPGDWYYGGYQELPNYDPSHRSNQLAWYNLAKGTAWGSNVYNVRIMKMYSGPELTGPAQDFIYEQSDSGPGPTPGKVPEPTTLALLALGGLPVLPFLRRRRPLA